ncbi:MAG: class I SAM-dependent RNA methyltransferase [Acidobacteria bacterium]|jgi:23S rRNA (uracil1939-C5)-methyltransferase|nr:class I SAM-dependent RNA methyltransferase [Acidobacteriota bacterium]
MADSSLVELQVERPVAGGRMLARLDGRVVFVAGAVPGERVRARITKRTGKVVWADTVEVIEASADRREAKGDPRCGGALYAHIAYERQLALKAEVIADTFRRIGKLTLDRAVVVAASPEEGYRLRARLHVQGTRVGFLLEGSHALCDAEVTRQLGAGAFEAVGRLREALGPALGACESIVVSENISGLERVALCELRPDADPVRFAGLPLTDGLSGVAALTRKGMFTCAGHDRIVEHGRELLGVETNLQWTRQAASFFQGNRFLVGTLLQRVIDAAGSGSFVDLYSGIGLFAVALADRGATGVAVEGDAASGQDLTLNAAQADGRLTVQLGPVEEAAASIPARRPDVVVVDPPRTGLSAEVADGLLRWESARVVYVSCDVPTLARDAAKFVAAGYRLSSIDALDMFPNTPHVECVAVFDR